MRVLVLAVSRYDFVSEKDGKRITGGKVTYITDRSVLDENRRGCEPMTVSVPGEVVSRCQSVPGVYEAEFEQRPGKDNKPQLVCSDLQCLQGLDVGRLIAAAAVPPVVKSA